MRGAWNIVLLFMFSAGSLAGTNSKSKSLTGSSNVHLGRNISEIIATQNGTLNSVNWIKKFSKEEFRANLIKYWDPERIINGTALYSYKENNPTKDGWVYIMDRDSIVYLPNVTLSAKTKRQYVPCTYWNEFSIDWGNAGIWWSSWCPASSCLQDTLSNGGGSIALYSSYTFTMQDQFNIGADKVLELLNVGFQMSFTQSWTSAETMTCNVNPGNNLQVWVKHSMGGAQMYGTPCQYCGYVQTCDYNNMWNAGYNYAPVNAGYQNDDFGCSSDPNYQCTYTCPMA